MAKQVTQYRSDSGKVFETEHEALRDDLRVMLTAGEKINDASADAFIAWVCTPRERLSAMVDVLNALRDTHPEAPQDSHTTIEVSVPAYLFTPNDFAEIGTNSGHGHAWERPDKFKARCGGTTLCNKCKHDKAMVEMQNARLPEYLRKAVEAQNAEIVKTLSAQIDQSHKDRV